MVFFGVPYDDHCLSHWLLTNALLAQHIICSIRFHILIVSVMLNNKQTYPLGIQNTYGKPSMLYNVIYKSGKSSNRPCSIVFHSHPFEFPVCRHRARPMDPRHQYEWHMGDLGWWPNLRWSGESHWWKMGKKTSGLESFTWHAPWISEGRVKLPEKFTMNYIDYIVTSRREVKNTMASPVTPLLRDPQQTCC